MSKLERKILTIKRKLSDLGFKFLYYIDGDRPYVAYENSDGIKGVFDISYISKLGSSIKYNSRMPVLIKIEYFNSKIDARYRVIDIDGDNLLINRDDISFWVPMYRLSEVDSIYRARYTKTNEFISKMIDIHGDDIYDYSNVDYTGSNNKVEVICKHHGPFYSTPSNLLSGHGCPECAYERNGWTRTSFREACERNRDGLGMFYVIRLNSELIKIGITSRDIESRFRRSSSMPYDYSIIEELYGDPDEIFSLAILVKRKFKYWKRVPAHHFSGMTEVFDAAIIDKMVNFLKKTENSIKILEKS